MTSITTPEDFVMAVQPTDRNLSYSHTNITDPQYNKSDILTRAFATCKNSDNGIDEMTAKTVERVLHTTVLTFLQIFGVITNVINMAVFHRQGLHDRINLCLFSLALADCVFLLLFSAAKFYSFLGLFDWSLEAYWSQRYLDTVLGLMLGTANVSNTITAIISLERCICVLSPFLAKKFFKTRYMAVLIAAMSVYVTGFYNLMTVKFATVYVTDPLTNTSHWTSQLSSFYLSNRVVTDVLNNYLLSLTIPCTSLGVVIVTTCITVLKLRSTLAWRLETTNVKTTSEKAKQDSVTKTLLVVCFVYLTCISLSLIQVLARTFVPGYLPTGKYCNTFTIGQTLGHLCEVTNASSSFLIYVTMGTKFRETVKTIFGDRKEEKVKEHRRNILSIKAQPQ